MHTHTLDLVILDLPPVSTCVVFTGVVLGRNVFLQRALYLPHNFTVGAV